jgi:hypothetical protein
MVVARVVHQRLRAAASLPDNELILECYHPSAKISTPYLLCRHLGVAGTNGESIEQMPERLPILQRFFSSFRPSVIEDDRRSWRFRTSIMNTMIDSNAAPLSRQEIVAKEDVFLDPGELFSQLCTVTHVAKEGPKHGLFVSHVTVSDGVIRVWRDWLARRASETSAGGDLESSSAEDRVLWADREKNVGVRFRVTLGPSEHMPLLSGGNDADPVSYTLEFEGK